MKLKEVRAILGEVGIEVVSQALDSEILRFVLFGVSTLSGTFST